MPNPSSYPDRFTRKLKIAHRKALYALLAVAGAGAVTVAVAAGANGAQNSPPPVRVIHNVVYKTVYVPRHRKLTLDVYLPVSPSASAPSRPAIVFVHGGGFVHGDKREFAQAAGAAARQGFVGFSINYRLISPGFPLELRDVRSAIAWVRQHARRYGVDPARIAVWGGSAGANLAVEAAMIGRGPTDRGDRVAAAVGWSGPYDFNDERGARPYQRHTVRRYLGCRPRRCRRWAALASPASHVDASDPPLLMANSTDEIVPLHQVTDMERQTRKAGVPTQVEIIRGSCHSLAYYPEAIGPTLAFLEHYLQGKPLPPPSPSGKQPIPSCPK